MATVTYAHHSLIQGNRKGTINGLIFTLILAMIFTSLQGFEYYTAPFTISDGAFGSTFYFATGFHGYCLCPDFFDGAPSYLDAITKVKEERSHKNKCIRKGAYLGRFSLRSKIKTEIDFEKWLSGFTDAEGNFNISLRKKEIDDKNGRNEIVSFSFASLTYQIGLHIDDLNVLKFIQKKLNCGQAKNFCKWKPM